MLFTIKKPVSKRFFAVSFEGFKPTGKNRIDQFFRSLGTFIKELSEYLFSRIVIFFFVLTRTVVFIIKLPQLIKGFLVRKLIWSRGRLGRPIATTIVVTASVGVFFLGEIFSGSSFVVEKVVAEDYLENQTAIIPKKESALTTLPDIRKRTESITYEVQPGDTLFTVGNNFKVSVDALKYVNNFSDSSTLRVGQKITIPPSSGLVHTVQRGETLSSIAQKYSVSSQAIADFNYLLNPSRLSVGTELVIPGAKIPEPVIPVVPVIPVTPVFGTGTPAPSKKYCVWPSTVRIITQHFSWYHNGLDVATPHGSSMPPIFSCTAGKVTRAGWDPFGLGLHVRIDHGGGYETIYGHMSKVDVTVGDRVSRGQIIGSMGNTGRSTGPHLHFIVNYNGSAQNPVGYME